MNLNTKSDYFTLGFALGLKSAGKGTDEIADKVLFDIVNDEYAYEDVEGEDVDLFCSGKDMQDEPDEDDEMTLIEEFNLISEHQGEDAAFRHILTAFYENEVIKEEGKSATNLINFLFEHGLTKRYCLWIASNYN